MLTIEEVYRLGKLIGLDRDSDLYPLFTTVTKVWSERYSFYIDEGKYHYVAMERGREVEHFKSDDLEDVLYFLFANATHSITVDYEAENRIENQSFRRILFAKQLELLGKIDGDYFLRRKLEIEEILKISPYRDNK